MKIENRELSGKKTRLAKKIPGVLYGKGFEAKSIAVTENEFYKALQQYGTSKTFTVTYEKEQHIVYVKETQLALEDFHKVTHFDLIKVSATDTLVSNVSLHFVGKDNFKVAGTVLVQNLHDLEIEYVVGKGITSLDVELEGLTEDTPIYVRDLKIPKGVKVLTDESEVVASLGMASKVEVEVDEDAEDLEVEVVEEEE